MSRPGYSNDLQARVLAGDAKIYTEAVVVHAQDVRQTKAAFDAATTMTNLETWPAGFVALSASDFALVSYASGSDNLTLIAAARPFEVVALEVDDAVGDGAVLRKAQFYVTRKRSAAATTFDGNFVLRVYRFDIIPVRGQDFWYTTPVCDPIKKLASSMSTDTELITYQFATATSTDFRAAPCIRITESLRPLPKALPGYAVSGRSLVFVLTAEGGSNTNYAWLSDSGATADATTVGAGTLHHRIASAPGDVFTGHSYMVVATGTGMVRCAFSIGSFPATGTISFTGSQKIDQGAATVGTQEFYVQKSVPAGASLIVQARATTTDAWVTVLDGQTPASLGITLSQTYLMQALFAPNGTSDATPILYAMGVQDRTATDITELCDWPAAGYREACEVIQGTYQLPEARLPILHTGSRDYQGMEALFGSTVLTAIQVRTLIGHPDLTRDKWLRHSLYDIDDIEPEDDRVVLILVSAAVSRLKGTFPTSAGTLYGYMLKSTAGTDGVPSAGADFNREMSEGTETANTITLAVATGATEVSYATTPPNVPNMTQFASGNLRTLVKVSTATSTSLLLKVRWERTNSAGTVQESTPYTDEQRLTAAGSYTFSQQNFAWSAGAVTDRFQVAYAFRCSAGATSASISVTIETGTVDTETRGPWIHTTQTAPVTYALVSPSSIFNDWLSQVGVASRYTGNPPPDTTHKLSKSIYETDGQRELERIARTAGGTIADMGGIVSFAPLYGQMNPLAAIIPLDTYQPVRVTLGYRSRLPQFSVVYGWDGGKFLGERKVKNSTAYTAFGLSRIDNPDARLDEETCKYFPDSTLADERGAEVVAAVGNGLISLEVIDSVPHPELTIGDTVAIETDRLFGSNPITSSAFRGPLWLLCRVVGIHDLWGQHLVLWAPWQMQLFDASTTNIQRQPYEALRVELEDISIASQPQNARVRLRSFPNTSATIYYYYATSTATIPQPGSWLWTAYSTAIDLARDSSAVMFLTAYARANGLDGPRTTWPIGPGSLATIGNLVGSEASVSVVSVVAGNVSDNARSIRYYANATTTTTLQWPTDTGLVGGVVSETYFKSERGVLPAWGGFDASGNAVAGGLVTVTLVSAVSTGYHVLVIAVPIDSNNSPGTNKTLDYTWAGATTPAASTAVVTINALGSAYVTSRTYDCTVTIAGAATATDTLFIYMTINGTRSLAATVSCTSSTFTSTNIAIGYYPSSKTGDPYITVSLDYELDRSGAIVAHGRFTPFPYETFSGHVI